MTSANVDAIMPQNDNMTNAALYFPHTRDLLAPRAPTRGHARAGWGAGRSTCTDGRRGGRLEPTGGAPRLACGAPPKRHPPHGGQGPPHPRSIHFPRWVPRVWGGGRGRPAPRRPRHPGRKGRRPALGDCPPSSRRACTGHPVGRLRAQRRAAVGADPPERRRLHAEPVPPGRLPGHDAARGVLRQVRQGDDHRRTTSTSASSTSWSASRRSSRPSSWSSRSSRWPGPDRGLRSPRRPWPVHRQPAALRPVQELQVPGQVGRPLRRRRQQGQRAQADDRGGRAPRGRRSRAPAASRPAARSTRPITLERGVTHDPEFEKWANKVWNFGAGLGAEVSLKDFRKDIIIEVYNEAGQLGARLQGLPLLGVGVPGAAGPRRQRQRGRDPDDQAREREAGSATTTSRTGGAQVRRAAVAAGREPPGASRLALPLGVRRGAPPDRPGPRDPPRTEPNCRRGPAPARPRDALLSRRALTLRPPRSSESSQARESASSSAFFRALHGSATTTSRSRPSRASTSRRTARHGRLPRSTCFPLEAGRHCTRSTGRSLSPPRTGRGSARRPRRLLELGASGLA